ncbi:hypothetical protein [Dactylosporangium darangshiense]|uniref:hypothetical protein n=1 Tax=Dactylosporangium darangshiense TaxID=579108 RepID=UPI0031ED490D
MTQPADESPTERQPASPTWVGSASVPPGGSRRRRQWEDTLDLPAAPPEPPPPPPKVQYVPVTPPGYRPGPIPPPWQFQRRRRRKWPWVLLVMFLLCAGCCGTSYAWARQWWVQYPASVNLEAPVPGLTRVNDASANQTAASLQTALTSDHLDEQGFTAVYRDEDRHSVLLFGATRFITHPSRDLEASLRKLGTKIQVQNVRKVDAGVLGGEQRCAAGRASSTICGWSDHGMIAIAVFPDTRLDEASTKMQNLRASITVRD